LENFEKKSAEKIWSNKDKGIKMSSPVPDGVEPENYRGEIEPWKVSVLLVCSLLRTELKIW
jgi:hypothetical protein